jgi:hypothetical protein
MEEIREIKITVYVDTNKTSYVEEFKDIDDALEYLETLLSRICTY